MQAEFISTYAGIRYKIPESDKIARFNNGRFSTNDEQTISYLREHPDYGVTLTEVENPTRRGIVSGVDICKVCGKVFHNRGEFMAHMKTHKKEKEDEE
jgi:hypothetical protein